MKIHFLATLVCLLILQSCRKNEEISTTNSDAIFQISTIDALLAGDLGGIMRFGELKDQGDFGVGTFDGANGEMVFFQDTFYQITEDGVVHPVSAEMTTPFAAVKHFQSDFNFTLATLSDYADLQKAIDSNLSNFNSFYAIRIHATFDSITVRSVPAQTPPYPSLSTVVEAQVLFPHQNISGTLVGFRLPPVVSGVNVEGYHFHFISDNRQIGGHVLNCSIRNAEVFIDQATELKLKLPE